MKLCDHCEQETDNPQEILGRKLCQSCYEVGIQNISKFLDNLLAPDDEFNEWLEEETTPSDELTEA